MIGQLVTVLAVPIVGALAFWLGRKTAPRSGSTSPDTEPALFADERIWPDEDGWVQ
jgi:hypothetical protein